MATEALGLALLVLAALLAALAATVRALRGVDGKGRPALLSAGVAMGAAAAGVGLAPGILGQGAFTTDASTVTILAGAVVVAAADLAEAAIGARLLLVAWPARAALRSGDAALGAGDPAGAAATYARAVDPLARSGRVRLEVDARFRQAAALVLAGQLNEAAIRLHEALERARSQADPELTWTALLRSAPIDADLDRLPLANRHLGEAATVARDSLSRHQVANVFAELAWVSYLAGDRELAGTCLGWAGRAAGEIDAGSTFAANTTLLAAQLALASGDLVAAESALAAATEMAPAIGDPDLDAGRLVARACLGYLQGWKDSARDALVEAQPALEQGHWRSRLVLPLVALTLLARRHDRPQDAAAFGKLAASLAAPGGTLAELAAHCADPDFDVNSSSRAAELRGLLAEPPTT